VELRLPDTLSTHHRLLFLPDGEALALTGSPEGLHCEHTGNGMSALFSGDFANAILMRADLRDNLRDNPRQRALLNHLSRTHPWLRDLTRTTPSPPLPSRLLLGLELGILFIELTARCNEHCLHCYAKSEPERQEILALADVRRVLDEARRLGSSAVQFTGGDPLIYPELVAAVACAREAGYDDIEIYTNGLLLTDALLARLTPHIPHFAFSVYSYDAATHDRITRVPGSHRRTLTAMRRVMAAGLELRAGVIIMPENRGHERQTADFLHGELGLPRDRIGFDSVRGTGRGTFMDYEPDTASTDQVHRAPKNHVDHDNRNVRRGKLCVASDGCVYPCIFSRNTLLGNIGKQSLADMLAKLDERPLPQASEIRWRQCEQRMSCKDCQIIAYTLGVTHDTTC